MFILALYLLCCKCLEAQNGVIPQLYADNIKSVSGDPDVLLHDAWFTTGFDRLVGQELEHVQGGEKGYARLALVS